MRNDQAEDIASSKKRTLTGKVISNKMKKTVVVQIDSRVKHPVYGKIITRRKKYKAHDESNSYNQGDVVEIQEIRPLSKSKTWKVIRLVDSAKII